MSSFAAGDCTLRGEPAADSGEVRAAAIRETVVYGAPALALEGGLFTARELLEWIATARPNLRPNPGGEDAFASDAAGLRRRDILIAYKAAAAVLPDREQYLADGRHVVLAAPALALYHATGGGDRAVPARSGGRVSLALALAHEVATQANLIDATADASVVGAADAAARSAWARGERKRDFVDSLRARNVWRGEPPGGVAGPLVAADWVERFRHTPDLPALLLKRLRLCEATAPTYAAFLAERLEPTLRRLSGAGAFRELDDSELAELAGRYPHLLPGWRELSPLALRISVQPLAVAGYYLGFPVQHGEPAAASVAAALLALDAGPAAFRLAACARTRPPFPCALPGLGAEGDGATPALRNHEDTLGNEPGDLSPFDVVWMFSGPSAYFFSRGEFSHLSETRRNPWTNEQLPAAIVAELRARLCAAAQLGLPAPAPLAELWEGLGQLAGKGASPPLSPASPPTAAPFFEGGARTNSGAEPVGFSFEGEGSAFNSGRGRTFIFEGEPYDDPEERAFEFSPEFTFRRSVDPEGFSRFVAALGLAVGGPPVRATPPARTTVVARIRPVRPARVAGEDVLLPTPLSGEERTQDLQSSTAGEDTLAAAIAGSSSSAAAGDLPSDIADEASRPNFRANASLPLPSTAETDRSPRRKRRRTSNADAR